MDTIDTMVVRGPMGWDPSPAPRGRRALVGGVVAGVLCVGVFLALVIEIPYYAVAPGTARQVNDLIAVPGDRANPPTGQVLLATVALRRVSLVEAVMGWLDPDTAVVSESQILGPRQRRDFTRENLEQMTDSKRLAVLVALRRLGFPVTEMGKGGLVVEVEPASPAAGHLVAGEVITAVDGAPTPLKQSVVEAVRTRRPGEAVLLTVQDVSGDTRDESVTLAPSEDGPSEAGFLGVVLRTRELSFDLPFEITIDSGTIGGPSAGLAFTLGVLDALTPGELTGGAKVAVTGTIDIEGRVGDVGGVRQKTAAVRAAGATVFLVPPGEYEEARARAGRGLQVRRVATLEQAIVALAQLGGDRLPADAGGPAAAA